MAKRKNNNLSKNKQAELLRKQGYSYREINRMDAATRKKISTLIIADEREQRKEKQYPKKQENRRKSDKTRRALQTQNRITKKRFALEKAGFSDAMQRGKISNKKIDSIKLSDIENGRVNRETYPWLFYDTTFNFDKVYQFKNGKRMFVAFRDYQGELDIEDALNQFSRYSNGELLDFLQGIVETPPTYQRGVSGSSSGKAGGFRFMVADQGVIEMFNKDAYQQTVKDRRAKKSQDSGKTRRKKRRQQYKGENVGFQVLKDGRRVSYDKVTPRNLLIMANAIMYNVTEQDRLTFYTRFYTDVTKDIPEMIQILPKPKF